MCPQSRPAFAGGFNVGGGVGGGGGGVVVEVVVVGGPVVPPLHSGVLGTAMKHPASSQGILQ